ncbi:MAG: dihydropteroate synthase [Planctomycetes bacterium SCN 63-9]|nr:MAG: dihydropteroate synthase [Planctomycetes bacterium SCN 63-9]
MPIWEACGTTILEGRGERPVPKVMGIVNITPDSFSDGGRNFADDAGVSHGLDLIAEGADLLDVGGESSRPGAEPVPLDEELRRVIPTIRGLRERSPVTISIDTTKAEIARRAIEAGATIINDISALLGDPLMGRVAVESGAGVVLMHMQGTPQTMQIDPSYGDVVAEVYDFLAGRVEAAEALGIPRSRIAIDPGIGFGKTFEHNLELMRNVPRFVGLGCAVLVGISRKGFLKQITGRSMAERTMTSVVSSLAACEMGADVIRVHDVGAMVDAIKVWTAVHGWEMPR